MESQTLEVLRRVLNKPNATWSCSGQQKAVAAVLARKTDVLSILATGTGKTMQIILPTVLLPRERSVVILPLKVLILDYERRLKEMNVSYQVWSTYNQDSLAIRRDVNLILVTVEQATKLAFKEALVHANLDMPIKRFFYDEAHIIITADHYRASMKNINEMRTILPVQFIVLSGTVPPTSMSTLRNAFGIMNNAVEIRTKTVRPEIQYVLEPPMKDWGNAAVVKRVAKLVECYTHQLLPGDRGLIYVETKNMGGFISKELNIARYEGGKTMNDQQRADSYSAWTSKDKGFMVCTSAFGAGVDWSTVRVVIFAGSPRSMINFIQEADRAGRDQLHSVVIIVSEPKSAFNFGSSTTGNPPSSHSGRDEMRTLLFSRPAGRTGCVRYLLSQFNDGVGTSCTDLSSAALCSHCSPIRLSEPPYLTRQSYTYDRPLIQNVLAQKRTIEQVEHSDDAQDQCDPFQQQHLQSKRQKDERLRGVRQSTVPLKFALDLWAGRCIACYILDPNDDADCGVPIWKCPQMQRICSRTNQSLWHNYVAFRDHLKFTSHDSSTDEAPNVCWTCAVPQVDDLHDTFVAVGTKGCKYDDTIKPLAWLIWYNEDERINAMDGLNISRVGENVWSSVEAYTTWLLKPGKPGTYNIHDLYVYWVEEDNEMTKPIR